MNTQTSFDFGEAGQGAPEIRGLSLTQPWATLVAIGAKQWETRSMRTNYRGPLAIHASKGFPGWAKDLLFTEPFFGSLNKAGLSPAELMIATVDRHGILPLGKILCICNLVDCIQITTDNTPPEPERSFGDYTPGRWMWKLEDIRRVDKPIECKGMLGLWRPSTDVLAQLKPYPGKVFLES